MRKKSVKNIKKMQENFAICKGKWYSDFMTLFDFVSFQNNSQIQIKCPQKQGELL